MHDMSSHSHSSSKLLPTFSSSTSSTSSDQQKLHKGACTGLIFQLFDWSSRLQKKHLCGQKSLPAERPERLIPKDLFCGYQRTSDEASILHGCEGQAESSSQKDQTPEKKRKKRSPNVVAKLMGLETMPSPDMRCEKWPTHSQRPVPNQNGTENSFTLYPRIPSSRRSLMDIEKGAMGSCSSRSAFCNETFSKDAAPHEQTCCQDKRFRDKARNVSTVRCGQSSSDEKNGTFGRVLASSDTQNLVNLPVKSSLASKSTVGAENTVQNRQPKSTVVRLTESQKMLAASKGENEKENLKETPLRKSSSTKERSVSSCLFHDSTQPTCASQKMTDGANLPAASRAHAANYKPSISSLSKNNMNMKEVAAAQHLKQDNGGNEDIDSRINIKEASVEQQLKKENGGQDRDFAKGHNKQEDVESSMEKNGKSRVKVQENTRRRLNDASSIDLQNRKGATLRPGKQLSSSETSVYSNESNNISSVSFPLSAITENRNVNSSAAISKNKRLCVSCEGKGDMERKKVSDEGGTVPKSTYTRAGVAVGCEKSISKSKIRASKPKSMAKKVIPESRKENSSLKSCTSKDLNQESGSSNPDFSKCDNALIVDQLSVSSCCSTQNPDGFIEEDALAERFDGVKNQNAAELRESLTSVACREVRKMDFDTEITSSDVISQNTCRSTAPSSLDGLRDTALSSYEYRANTKKQTVSYSGKSTATILQELLCALNSSAKLSTVELEQAQQDSAVSDVTSATVQTVCSPSDASGSCTEVDSKSMDLRIPNSNASLHNSMQDCEPISNRDEDINFKGCIDDCWESNPASCCVSAFHSQPNISFERVDFLTEKHNCRHCWSKSVCKDGLIFGRTISKDEDMSKETDKLICSEEDYVATVVKTARLSPDEIFSAKLQRTNSILNPANFHRLEDTYRHSWEWRTPSTTEADGLYSTNVETVHQDEDVAKDYRKLVFDCVHEGLNLDLGINEDSEWSDYNSHLNFQEQTCCRKVLKHIHDWKGVRCGMNVDDMVENTMNTGVGKWIDFSGEFSDVAGEVGASIYNDLVDELVADLRYSCWGIADMRGAKTHSLGKMEKKRLIWVGL